MNWTIFVMNTLGHTYEIYLLYGIHINAPPFWCCCDKICLHGIIRYINWRASKERETLSGVYPFEICDMCIYILYGHM